MGGGRKAVFGAATGRAFREIEKLEIAPALGRFSRSEWSIYDSAPARATEATGFQRKGRSDPLVARRLQKDARFPEERTLHGAFAFASVLTRIVEKDGDTHVF